MPEYNGFCEKCSKKIHKCKLTQGKDLKYYCMNCLIELNKSIEHREILKNRKKELIRQLSEIKKELEEDRIVDFMYS